MRKKYQSQYTLACKPERMALGGSCDDKLCSKCACGKDRSVDLANYNDLIMCIFFWVRHSFGALTRPLTMNLNG